MKGHPENCLKETALLAPWRGGRSVLEVEALAGGIMNWNYRVRLAGSAEQFVLRFYDRMPASCAKETRLLELLQGDVPVPGVLFVAPDGANECSHGWSAAKPVVGRVVTFRPGGTAE